MGRELWFIPWVLRCGLSRVRKLRVILWFLSCGLSHGSSVVGYPLGRELWVESYLPVSREWWVVGYPPVSRELWVVLPES